MGGELRHFEMTVTKDRSTSDSAQVPASGITLDFYPEGAYVVSGGPISNSTVVTVQKVGDFQPGDTGQIGVSGTGTFTVDANGVSPSARTLTLTLTGGSGTISANDRLMVTDSDRRPKVFTDDQGHASTPQRPSSPGNSMTTDSLGYADGYIPNRNVDIKVSGIGVTTRLVVDVANTPSVLHLNASDEGVVFNDQSARAADNVTNLQYTFDKVAREISVNKSVIMPSGIAQTNAVVNVNGSDTNANPSSVEIIGTAFSTIKATAGTTLIGMSNTASDTYRIRGMKFDGNSVASLKAWLIDRNFTALWFENCIFANCATAIQVGELSSGNAGVVDQLFIEDCIFDTMTAQVILIRRLTRGVIARNHFRGAMSSDCVVVQPQASANDVVHHLTIAGNFFHGTQSGSPIVLDGDAFAASGTKTVYDVIVAENHIEAAANAGVDILSCHDVDVIGNRISGGSEEGIIVDSMIGGSVKGNTLVGAANANGLVVRKLNGNYDNERVLVSENIISGCGDSGMDIEDANRCVISSNMLHTNNQDGPTSGDGGIDVSGAAVGLSIVSNHIYNNPGVGSGFGINLSASTSDCLIATNWIEGHLNDINDGGTDNVQVGNMEGS